MLDADDNLQASTGQDPVATAKGAPKWPRRWWVARRTDPQAVELPGIVYDRTDPETVKAWLAGAK